MHQLAQIGLNYNCFYLSRGMHVTSLHGQTLFNVRVQIKQISRHDFATYVMQRDLQAPPAARHRGAISRHLHLDDWIFFFLSKIWMTGSKYTLHALRPT